MRYKLLVAGAVGLLSAFLISTVSAGETSPSGTTTTKSTKRVKRHVRVRVRKRVRVRIYGPHYGGTFTYYNFGFGSPGACGYKHSSKDTYNDTHKRKHHYHGLHYGTVAMNPGSPLHCGDRIHLIHANHYRPLWGRTDFIIGDTCPGCGRYGMDVLRGCGCGWSNPHFAYRPYHYGYRWRWRYVWRWR